MEIRRLTAHISIIIFVLALFITCIFGNYMLSVLFLPALFFGAQRQWRFLADRAISFWLIVPVTLMHYLLGIKIKVTGVPIDGDQPALIIMNHRTRLDWMYFWGAIFKMNPLLLITSKIALKDELKKIPGAGFGMSANQFLFLKRKLDDDKPRLNEAIEYYSGIGFNYQLLFFPEGTDKSEWTTKKSNEYAAKNGLPQLNHLIYPRSTGINYLIKKMRECNYLTSIYNITVAYPENIVQSEFDMVFKGATTKEVHFDIERIEYSNVPSTDIEVAEWINKMWIEKEMKLKDYYAKPKELRRFPTDMLACIWQDPDEPLHIIMKFFVIVFWFSTCSVWIYHLLFLKFLQCIALYAVIVYILIHCVYGGLDRMVYSCWNKYIEKKKKSRLKL